MSFLTDVLAALDRWEEWKKMRAAPARIDELEKRLAALETSPPELAGEHCKACGKPALRRTSQTERKFAGHLVGYSEVWTCGSCGETDIRARNI